MKHEQHLNNGLEHLDILLQSINHSIKNMTIIINDSENAAFCDEHGNPCEECARREYARIVRFVADKIEDGAVAGNCFDLNGNKVGSWIY